MTWSTVGNIRGPQGVPGLQGVQGVQGVPGAVGPAGLNFRGAYSAATQYTKNDSVAFGGTTYFALDPAPTMGTPPTADPNGDDTAVNTGWAVLALEGARGLQGAQGLQGIQGTPGTAGATGATGQTGPTGARGSQWYVGSGAPITANYPGAVAGDQYLDSVTGDVYTFA